MNELAPHKNDLVIGMTLAEVFLLLLIVGWYGSRLEAEAEGVKPGTPAEVLQKQLHERDEALRRATEERDQFAKKITDLEAILKWLGERLGSPQPIHDIPSATAAVNVYTTGLKRGKPVCESANVLVRVSADEDKLTLTFLQPIVFSNSEFSVGRTLSDRLDIEHFLETLDKYYSERRKTGRDCAFDFTLEWRTDRDFRIAKKMFEPHFYPAGDRQLQ
jgi:hypothetical protein